MYCKNCSKELTEDEKFCSYCGTERGKGDKYCPNCKMAISPEQVFCVNCGVNVKESEDVSADGDCGEGNNAEALEHKHDSSSSKKDDVTAPEYAKYIKRVKKINIFSLVAQILSVLAIICLVFLPIYRAEISITSGLLENIAEGKDFGELGELFGEAWEDGKVKVSFSLFDDLVIMVDGFFSDGDFEAIYMSFMYSIMPLFEVIFSVVILVSCGKQIYKISTDMTNSSNCAMLKYNEMKKTGSTNRKANWFRQQNVMAVAIYAVMDILFSVTIDRLLNDTLNDVGFSTYERYMTGFCGLSGVVIIPIALLIAYIVMQSLIKKEEKSMLVEITEEQYETK